MGTDRTKDIGGGRRRNVIEAWIIRREGDERRREKPGTGEQAETAQFNKASPEECRCSIG